MVKHTIRLTDSVIVDVIIFLLGMTLLTQFYDLLFNGIFTPFGFSTRLIHLAQYIENENLVKNILLSFVHIKIIAAPLLGITLLSAAICMLFGIARGVVSIFVGIAYLLTWVVLWHFPSVWTFEFLFPALFGICAGLSKLTQPVLTTSIYQKLFASRTIRVTVVILLTALLWYVTFIAYTDADFANKTAKFSAVTFLMLSLINLGLDEFIINRDQHNGYRSEILTKIATLPWIDIMVIIIGSMLIMQVYANFFSGLYIKEEYTNLIKFYSTASNAIWLRPFLIWSATHSYIYLPLQIVFESALAILLTLLILRGPTLIATGILCIILAFAELGVSASWPADPNNLNWQWELLLVSAVSFLIGINRTKQLWHASSIKEMILGKKLFSHMSPIGWATIALIGGCALYGAGMVTRIFGDTYKIISPYSGITFFVLLLLLGLIDKYRGNS